MHHDIQKIISYYIFYLFFPICKWKEFESFQLLENFKKNVLTHRPSIKKSLCKSPLWSWWLDRWEARISSLKTAFLIPIKQSNVSQTWQQLCTYLIFFSAIWVTSIINKTAHNTLEMIMLKVVFHFYHDMRAPWHASFVKKIQILSWKAAISSLSSSCLYT